MSLPLAPSTSNGSSDLNLSSGTVEKISHTIDGAGDNVQAAELTKADLEKKMNSLSKATSWNSNVQVVPGVLPGECDHDEGSNTVRRADDHGQDVGNEQSCLPGVIGQALSRTSTKSSWNPGPPPDGGMKAWTAVAAGHLIVLNTWGYINSFGIFQTYYTTTLDLPPSTISWIGSIQVFLLFFIGTFTGRLTDAGYFRATFLLGSAFQVVGIFMTSICTEYWQVLLAQGLCMGIGNGFLFCPALATISTYFSGRRGLAIGITACGSSTGGLIFPAMARQLLPTVGLGWTIRAIGFVQLVGLVLANFGLRRRVPPRRAGALVEWAAFRELEYALFAAGTFTVSVMLVFLRDASVGGGECTRLSLRACVFNPVILGARSSPDMQILQCFLGVYFAFYYLTSFSRDIIGLSYTDSLDLLLLLNGIGIIGRLVLNHLADRYGAINVFIPTAVIAGICQLAWIAVASPGGLYAWTVFYGIAGGGIQSLFPAGLSSLTTDLRKAGTRMGMVFTINSFATLAGPPIAGAIISRCGGEYYGAQAFAGVVLLIGGGFFMAARLARQRRIGRGWRVKV